MHVSPPPHPSASGMLLDSYVQSTCRIFDLAVFGGYQEEYNLTEILVQNLFTCSVKL